MLSQLMALFTRSSKPCAADDVHQLARDRRLARAVVLQGQAGRRAPWRCLVAESIAVMRAPCSEAELSSERAPDLGRDIARHEPVEDAAFWFGS